MCWYQSTLLLNASVFMTIKFESPFVEISVGNEKGKRISGV